jgi:hypothetical protein
VMDRADWPRDEKATRRELAAFGLVQQVCVIGLCVVVHSLLDLLLRHTHPLAMFWLQTLVAVFVGCQGTLLYCQQRKLRSGEREAPLDDRDSGADRVGGLRR